MAIEAMLSEMALDPPSEPIRNIIRDLQHKDAFVVEQGYRSVKSRARIAGSEPAWAVDDDDLLRYKGALYVPESPAVREEILGVNYDDPHAGHFGFYRTLELVRRKYYWLGMRNDIKKYLKTCEVCQRVKTKRHRPHGELAPFPAPTRPWQEITMDFITGLPPSK